jgi:RNA polymerase sigma factor (sigma-70 family)
VSCGEHDHGVESPAAVSHLHSKGRRMALRADDVDLVRDRDLVLCAQSGDDDAFGDLYRRYFARLYRYCLRRVGDPHEAEELTQEAFARAYGALPRLEGERRFYPWLSVIASRLCVDAFRRRARSEPAPVIELDVLEAGHEDVDDADDVALIGRALNRLTPRHRHVLKLREQDGWSYQHIADHYDVSLGTVEALLHRARRSLRREFDLLAGADSRRGFGLPVLGWVARRLEQARSRIGGWETAWTPVIGNAVAAGVVVVGSALSGPAAAPTEATAVHMIPAATVQEAPRPVEAAAPAEGRAAAALRPAVQGAPVHAVEAATPTAVDHPEAPRGEGLLGASEARRRSRQQPTGGDTGNGATGGGLDPAGALVDAVRSIDHTIDEFEERP